MISNSSERKTIPGILTQPLNIRSTLEDMGFDAGVITGINIFRACITREMKIDGKSRREDPEHLTRMAQEYDEASKKSTAAKSMRASRRRWTDFLGKYSLFRENPDFAVGINICRACDVDPLDRIIRNTDRDNEDPLNKDPNDFWEKVDTFKEVKKKFTKGEIDLDNRRNIHQWKHDFNNVLHILICTLGEIESPHIKSIINKFGKCLNKIARFLQNLNVMSTDDFLTYVYDEFFPISDQFIEDSESSWSGFSEFEQDLINDMATVIKNFKKKAESFKKSLEGSKEHKAVKLNECLMSLSDFSHLLSHDVAFELNFDSKDNFVLWADPSDIMRAFENLIKNAHDSLKNIKEGIKKIKISVSSASLGKSHNSAKDKGEAFLKPLLSDGSSTKADIEIVSIKISDTGGGIHPDIKEKIFNDCFSTKGEGHGEGLDIVANIINYYGGQIYIDEDDDVSRGACFSVLLPVLKK
jgi:hypothetical protein